MSKKKKQQEEMEQEMKDAVNGQPTEEANNSKGAENDSSKSKQSGAPEKSMTPEDRCIELNSKIEELNAKYLYLFAEFDNYRKRTQKERIDLIKSASSDIIVQMLPILDDLDRATKSFDTTQDLDAIKEGVNLIHNKFKNILVQKGLEEIKAVGETFDTDLHEAIANVAADCEENKGKVLDMVEKGYFLNGKVLRFAKVLVAN
jgi:molecular chaperone GrpE